MLGSQSAPKRAIDTVNKVVLKRVFNEKLCAVNVRDTNAKI